MDNLETLLEQNNIKFTRSQLSKLKEYKEILLISAEQFNLTTIKANDFDVKHILDSIYPFKYVKLIDGKSCLDVGTGAGVPGIILSIFFPKISFTLLDSSNKKIDFLRTVISKMNLKNVEVACERIENFDKKFDYVVARAVAKLPTLVEICSNKLVLDGELILYKGMTVTEEMCPNIEGKIHPLGLIFYELIKYNLIEYKRTLIIYKKYANNIKGYPRSFSQIKRKDLCKYENNINS